LEVFQFYYALALDVSRVARGFPQFEQFELSRQLRKAARSIPVNIVEGWAKRASVPEFKRFLMIAIGSCDECKVWLDLSRDEGYLPGQACEELQNRLNRIGAMLKSLWKQWRSNSGRVFFNSLLPCFLLPWRAIKLKSGVYKSVD